MSERARRPAVGRPFVLLLDAAVACGSLCRSVDVTAHRLHGRAGVGDGCHLFIYERPVVLSFGPVRSPPAAASVRPSVRSVGQLVPEFYRRRRERAAAATTIRAWTAADHSSVHLR